jgi:hypothetical protein
MHKRRKRRTAKSCINSNAALNPSTLSTPRPQDGNKHHRVSDKPLTRDKSLTRYNTLQDCNELHQRQGREPVKSNTGPTAGGGATLP